MDFFFAELKRRGIYVYFDLLDYRRFLPGDNVRDAAQFEHGWHHSIKGATIFNDRLIELQKEFATAFLTHHNPYTKLRYVDDPAFAEWWVRNRTENQPRGALALRSELAAHGVAENVIAQAVADIDETVAGFFPDFGEMRGDGFLRRYRCQQKPFIGAQTKCRSPGV